MAGIYKLKREDYIYKDVAQHSADKHVILKPEGQYLSGGNAGGLKANGWEVYLNTKDGLRRALKIGNNRYFLWEVIDKKLQDAEHAAFLGGLFKKKDKKATSEIATKKELTPEEAEQLHKESGSKKPFSEWVKSDSGKAVAGFLSGIALTVSQNLGNKNTGTNTNNNTTDNKIKPETKKGISPIVWGAIAVGVLAVGIGAFVYMSKQKA
jgi:hypothetical protein